MAQLLLMEPFRAVFYTPYYVALDRGLFAAHGADIRIETAGTPDAAAARLLDGSADLAWSGPMRPMLERSRNDASPLRSFGAAIMRDPFLLMGMGARPGFAMADLATMRVAIPSEVPTPWWCLQQDLRDAGVDPAAMPGIRFMPMGDGAKALLAGEVDAVLLFEPFASALEEQGAALWYAAASRGPTAYSALYAITPRIAEKEAAFRGAVAALGEALEWIAASTPEAIAELLAPRFADTQPRHLLSAVARYKSLGLWEGTTRLPEAALDRLAISMVGAGAMTHHPGYAACIDSRFD
jgi:NitT/TauT family transport system substrate-binding protein